MQRRHTRFDEARAARADRFAAGLAGLLHELKITHKALARELGITHHTVNSWTRGVDPNIPGEANLRRLCALLEARTPGAGKAIAALAGLEWSLDAGSGPAEREPAVRIGETPHTNLPHALTSFVGREHEIASLTGRLGTSSRLVTITGPGGVGKTRLALQVAGNLVGSYPHGVWLVELASLDDPALVPQVVGKALGVHEQRAGSVQEALVDHLRSRRTLLVLDNCEHLVEACAALAVALLSNCPHLVALATSREALRIPGEMVWPLLPLSLPGPGAGDGPPAVEHLARSEALRLFADRAGAILPDFALDEANAEAVAQICRRLDGMPLAIELAVAQLPLLTVHQIARRLDDRFNLLTSGSRMALPRHQTLQATIDWSYQLLSAPEQALFSRLAVFAGGWSLEAAETVCRGEGVELGSELHLLRQLVDKSLVLVEAQEHEARYRMLETIHRYALGRLDERGEREALRREHAAYCLSLAERMEQELRGPQRTAWLDRIETEHDNMRAALRWAIDRGDAVLALWLAGTLRLFWNSFGYLSEARRWLEEALSMPSEAHAGDATYLALRAKALNGAGIIAYNQGLDAQAKEFYEESLGIRRALGDRQGIATTLNTLGVLANRHADYERALELFAESLAIQRSLEDKREIAGVLHNMAEVPLCLGEYERAHELFEESLALFRELDDKMGVASTLDNLGIVRLRQEAYAEAIALLEETLGLHRDLRMKRGTPYVLKNLGNALLRHGEHERATAAFSEGLSLAREIEDRPTIAECLAGLAAITAVQSLDPSELERAEELVRSAQAMLEDGTTLDPPSRAEYELNIGLVRAAGERPRNRPGTSPATRQHIVPLHG